MSKMNCMFCNEEVGYFNRSISADGKAVCNRCRKDCLLSVFKISEHNSDLIQKHANQVAEGRYIWDSFLQKRIKTHKVRFAKNTFFDEISGLIIYIDHYRWRKKGLKACAFRIGDMDTVIFEYTLTGYMYQENIYRDRTLTLINKHAKGIFTPIFQNFSEKILYYLTDSRIQDYSASAYFDPNLSIGDKHRIIAKPIIDRNGWLEQSNKRLKRLYYGYTDSSVKCCEICGSVLQSESSMCMFCGSQKFIYRS